INIFGNAAQAVAAHLRLATVGVEHAHAGVGFLGRTNQDQTIGADSEMTVAHCPPQFGRIGGHGVPETIKVEVVVSGALHVGEAHYQPRPSLASEDRGVTPTRSSPSVCC